MSRFCVQTEKKRDGKTIRHGITQLVIRYDSDKHKK